PGAWELVISEDLEDGTRERHIPITIPKNRSLKFDVDLGAAHGKILVNGVFEEGDIGYLFPGRLDRSVSVDEDGADVKGAYRVYAYDRKLSFTELSPGLYTLEALGVRRYVQVTASQPVTRIRIDHKQLGD